MMGYRHDSYYTFILIESCDRVLRLIDGMPGDESVTFELKKSNGGQALFKMDFTVPFQQKGVAEPWADTKTLLWVRDFIETQIEICPEDKEPVTAALFAIDPTNETALIYGQPVPELGIDTRRSEERRIHPDKLEQYRADRAARRVETQAASNK